MTQEKKKFKKEITVTMELDYLLYLPEDFLKGDKYPLVLFLHGAGERGDNIELVKKHGLPKLINEGRNFPFIVISPQCPEGSWWNNNINQLKELLADIKSKYPVDENRIYLTGLSMGGYGTWELAISYPEHFAAILPICGGVVSKWFIHKTKDIPCWIFHGEKDKVVPVSEAYSAEKMLKECGSSVKLTIYPEAGHDSWSATYENPEIYKWMLEQKRN